MAALRCGGSSGARAGSAGAAAAGARCRPPAAALAAAAWRRQQQQHRRPRAVRCRADSSSGSGSSGSSGAVPARCQQVLDAIDALNAQDPRRVAVAVAVAVDTSGGSSGAQQQQQQQQVQQQQLPYELAYSRWLTDWALRLRAEQRQPPSEELRIAARGQHVERWRSPRDAYPAGREGYLKWREDLKRAHAATVARLMEEAGYGSEQVERARRLILKREIKRDAEGQVLEDALCLVFLQRQFAELLGKEGHEKMVSIVRKTLPKMSAQGQQAALGLDLPAEQAAVVKEALAELKLG